MNSIVKKIFFTCFSLLFTFNINAQLTCNAYVNPNPAFNGQDVSCNGATDGEVCVDVTAGFVKDFVDVA